MQPGSKYSSKRKEVNGKQSEPEVCQENPILYKLLLAKECCKARLKGVNAPFCSFKFPRFRWMAQDGREAAYTFSP